MKNLIDIYEGILGDIDTNIDKMDDDVKHVSKFAYKFKLVGCQGVTSSSSGMIVSANLKRAIKNLSVLKNSLNTDAIERGLFSGSTTLNKKCREFLLWLDNMDLSSFAGKDFGADGTRKEFNLFLQQEMTNTGILNAARAMIHVTSTSVGGKDEIRLMLSDTHKWRDAIQFRFKIVA